MKILGNRILIQPTAPQTKLPSGLYLPETAVQKQNTGTIVEVGIGADPYWQGKHVLYNRLTAVNIEGNDLIHVTDLKMIL